MLDVTTIVEKIGRTKLRRALGVSQPAISNAEKAGLFPSAWYEVVYELSMEEGVPAPRRLFNFKRRAEKSSTGEPMVSE